MEENQTTNSIQNLYYALGELAYAIAKADGAIQNEEKQILHHIVISELKKNNFDIENIEIIPRFMEQDDVPVETTYREALDLMRTNNIYLSETLKEKFISFIQTVADAFPPVTIEEQSIIDRFKKDINEL